MTSGSSTESRRLFVGIPLPDEWTLAFQHVRDAHEDFPLVRWVPETYLHVTLHFIGNVPHNAIPELITQMESLAGQLPSFSLTFDQLCLTPKPRPYMVWAQFAMSTVFNDLAYKVAQCCPGGGGAGDKTQIPHCTLARFKKLRKYDFFKLDQTLPLTLPVDRMVLWESLLKASGAEYSPLAEFRLEG